MTVKGHIKQRQREWQRMGHHVAEPSGEANVAGWEQLRAFLGRTGADGKSGATIIAGGESLIQ